MRTVEDLGKDTIAKCSGGMMEFLGIPERFLKKVTEEKFFRCFEPTCALVRLVKTRARGNREAREDKEELEEATKDRSNPKVESHKKSKLQTWVFKLQVEGV